MFIRPVGDVVHPAERAAGRPLLRGLLARGAYVWDGGEAGHAAAVAAPPAAAPAAPAVQAELADQLGRLADLAREGLLTPEEFTAAKSRLLDR
ncbi:SHOCT domain-containing protein [Streptomyces sp. NPDC002054]|uniref:SHOCT domain-containing protein n=1 Tax=Streptomyces sp. NPDC002054 TaxID=3154663 RepID=UPI00332F64C8